MSCRQISSAVGFKPLDAANIKRGTSTRLRTILFEPQRKIIVQTWLPIGVPLITLPSLLNHHTS